MSGKSTIAAGLLAVSLAQPAAAEVELLRFPHPYRAALTISSDTHRTELARFEAVHRLVNGSEQILPGTKAWSLLFAGSAVEQDPRFAKGVAGHRLPIADGFYLFDDEIGAFESFDAERGAVANDSGQDLPAVLDAWFRRGWIDALHACGRGPVDRDAMRTGLAWLAAEPDRHTSVVTNHSFGTTPCGVEPDTIDALSLSIKNGVKLPFWLLSEMGASDLARRFAKNPEPGAFPPEQRTALRFALLIGGIGAAVWIWGVHSRHRGRVGASTLVMLGVSFYLGATDLAYSAGDNPGTRWYSLDLQRDAGIRFYSFIQSAAYPERLVADSLALPWTDSPTGRPTILQTVRADDGSELLAFPRIGKGPNARETLAWVTDARLDALVAEAGISILWTHWASDAKAVFTPAGLAGLGRIRDRHDAGELWVAPLAELLRFHAVQSRLTFKTLAIDGHTVVEIESPTDPAELVGISFRDSASQPPELRVAGARFPEQLQVAERTEAGWVVRIRAATPRTPVP